MSLLSQGPRPISGLSQTLLREARRAKRAGYGQLANSLAEAGTERKIQEKLAGGGQKLEQREAALADMQAQQASALNRQQLAGRQAFAKELRGMAKTGAAGTDVLGYAQGQGAKYGLSASQISSFFDREKLRTKIPGAAPTPGTGTAPGQNPVSGIMNQGSGNTVTTPPPPAAETTPPPATPQTPPAKKPPFVGPPNSAMPRPTGVQGATGLDGAKTSSVGESLIDRLRKQQQRPLTGRI